MVQEVQYQRNTNNTKQYLRILIVVGTIGYLEGINSYFVLIRERQVGRSRVSFSCVLPNATATRQKVSDTSRQMPIRGKSFHVRRQALRETNHDTRLSTQRETSGRTSSC